MCTYQTDTIAIRGSGKARRGWINVTDATVYFDHPVHLATDHTLMIDVTAADRGPDTRVALGHDPVSARALAESTLQTLGQIPAGLMNEFIAGGDHR